jgi:hypothetical protein
MAQDLASAAVGWLVVLPLVLWASRYARRERLQTIALVAAVYLAAIGLTHVPHYIHPIRIGNWNWSGKIISATFIYAVIFAVPALRPARAYITLRQRRGWIPGTLAALILLVGIQVVVQFYYHGQERFSSETLIF